MSKNYFSFDIPSSVLPSDGIFTVHFNYSLGAVPESNFKLRPKLSNGIIYIFDANSENWISAQAGWKNLPYLSKEITLKATLPTKGELSFELQNTTNFQIYETPTQSLWSHRVLENYLDITNIRLSSVTLPQGVPFTPAGEAYYIEKHFDYFTAAFGVTVFAIFVLHKEAFAMLEYLYDYVKEMVALRLNVFAYICVIFTAWSYSIQ